MTADDSSTLAIVPVEEGSLPVSARKEFLNAREEQMKLILRCYMENADFVSRLKDDTDDECPAFEENLYSYYVDCIRRIEEDDHSMYGSGYYSQYGTRQSSRREIARHLKDLSRKFKIRVNAPSLKTIWKGRPP